MPKIGIQNIGPLVKVYKTRLRKKIENEERAHFKAHYQKELDDVKSNMARMTSLLKQLPRAQSGEGTSSQQPTLPQPLVTPVIMDP
jgi:hypothetical protein